MFGSRLFEEQATETLAAEVTEALGFYRVVPLSYRELHP